MHRDPVADRYGLSVQMRIAGRNAIAVVDLDDLAVSAAVTGIGHHASRGGVNRGHVCGFEVDPGVL